MNNLTLAAQTIKSQISAIEVGNALGLEIRHGRCQCPIHGGKDYNCVLYKGNRGYYCHVCKAGGDVVSFVQRYYDTSFKDAVAWFNDTFRMGLDLDKPLRLEERKAAENARKMRMEAIEFREFRERVAFDLALVADRIVELMEEQRDRNVPKTADEDWNPDFCWAVRMLPAARRFAEDCWYDCVKKEET